MKNRLAPVLMLIALGAAFLSGALFRGFGVAGKSSVDGLLAGAPYGACSALEAAKAEKLLGPEAADRLYGELLDREEKLIQRYDRKFQFRRSEQNCPAVLLDLQYKMREIKE